MGINESVLGRKPAKKLPNNFVRRSLCFSVGNSLLPEQSPGEDTWAGKGKVNKLERKMGAWRLETRPLRSSKPGVVYPREGSVLGLES